MIVLHAITLPLSPGTDTEGLQAYAAPTVTVLYDEADHAPPVDRASVLHHGLRISRLGDRLAVLPMRYGTTVETLAELTELVAAHDTTWSERLSVVRGHCELIVHVDTADEEALPRAGSGREYLLARAQLLRQQATALDEVSDVVRPWSRDLHILSGGERLAALVPRRLATPARGAVTDWAATRRGVRVAVTGPWPPFSFCGEQAAS